MHHGEPGDDCYAIVSGDVLVTANTRHGSRVVLSRRGAGSIIGLLSAIEPGRRSASVVARSTVEAIRLSQDELEAILREDPVFTLNEMRSLAKDVRTLTERYSLRGDELRSRLARLLLTHFDESGQASFRSTRQELADWVGATREATTRTLKELEDAGLLELSRGAVSIRDRSALSRLV